MITRRTVADRLWRNAWPAFAGFLMVSCASSPIAPEGETLVEEPGIQGAPASPETEPLVEPLPSSVEQRSPDNSIYPHGDATLHSFPNKISLIHRRNPSNRIVGVTCLARPGALLDTEEKMGQTNLMARLLTKGTANRTSDEISEELEGMGADLSASASRDFVGVQLRCALDDLEKALEIYADIIRNPSFPLEEIRTEKARVQAQIRADEDVNARATMKRLRSDLFPAHPYGWPLYGEAETVKSLTQTDLVEAHREVFVPENMIFCVVGDISEEDAVDLFDRAFGDMPKRLLEMATSTKDFDPASSYSEFQRDVEQGCVAMGTIVCPVGHPDSAAIEVATAILGRGMSSRLFHELRDRRGLAYAVGAFCTQHRYGGAFVSYILTSPGNIDRVIGKPRQAAPGPPQATISKDAALEAAAPPSLPEPPPVQPISRPEFGDALWDHVELLRQEPVPAGELDRAKSYLVGSYLRSHETNLQQSYYLAYWAFYGLGIEFDQMWPDLIRRVTSRDVMRVANKYLLDPNVVVLRPEGREALPGPLPE